MCNNKRGDADPLCAKLRSANNGVQTWINNSLKR